MKTPAITGLSVCGALAGIALACGLSSAKAWPFAVKAPSHASRSVGFELPPLTDEGRPAGLAAQEKQVEALERGYARDRVAVLRENSIPASWNLPFARAALHEALWRDAQAHPHEAAAAVLNGTETGPSGREPSSWITASILPGAWNPPTGQMAKQMRFHDRVFGLQSHLLRVVLKEWFASDPSAAFTWMKKEAPPELMFLAGFYYWKAAPDAAAEAIHGMDNDRKACFIAGLFSHSVDLSPEKLNLLIKEAAGLSRYGKSGIYDEGDFDSEQEELAEDNAVMGGMPPVNDAVYLRCLRQLARQDLAKAERYWNKLDANIARNWLEMQIGLVRNNDDWAKTNEWLIKKKKGESASQMQMFWRAWARADFAAFQRYAKDAPFEYETALRWILVKERVWNPELKDREAR